jgi:membrane protein
MSIRSLTDLPIRLRDRLRARFQVVDTLLTVHERVGAVGGGPMSSAIAMATFLSLFPLILVCIAVVGVISLGDVDFAQDLVEGMGLEGRAEDTVLDAIDVAERSRRTATIVGLVGLVWAGLGVVAAVEGTLNAVWQVKGRGLAGKLHQLAWLVGAGGLLVASLAIGPLLNVLPGPVSVATVVVGLGVDTLLFLWTFTRLTNAPVGWRDHLRGAVMGGIGLGILKLVGGVFVPRLVASSSALYGSIGVVFALLAWLLLGAKLLVYAATYNVVRYERQHGTVTIDLAVPRLEGQVPLEATRGGAVADTAPTPP